MQASNGKPPIIQVNELKTYFRTMDGEVRAVNGVTLDIKRGESLGLVGESGCGKSVTAFSILRLLPRRTSRIASGSILFNRGDGSPPVELTGVDPNGDVIRHIRGNEIAMIFQEPLTSLSPVHTVGSQIAEAIELHQSLGKTEAKEKAIQMLESVGIASPRQRYDEYPHQFSGGMRQRAMIAMALSCDPRLLIADEPTTALDVTTQAQILDLLRQLQEQRGMAIMLITHNLGVIAEMADDVVVMYLGRVVEEGPVDDVFHAPKHPYTKALLRSIPSIESISRAKLPTITGSIPHPYNRPKGCPFHPRCPDFMRGTCDQQEPTLLSVNERQKASCFLYENGKKIG